MGQGPIGLMFTMLVKRTGARVASTDTIAERRANCDAVRGRIHLGSARHGGRERGKTAHGRTRRGPGDRSRIDPRDCRTGDCLFPAGGAHSPFRANGSHRARRSIGRGYLCGRADFVRLLQRLGGSAKRVGATSFSAANCRWRRLISHRLPLVKIRSGFDLALHPGPKSLKIIVQPQRWA